MKITRLQVTPMRNRGMLLEMHTDEGLVGYGSPMNYEHGRTVEQAIHDMSYSRQMPILLSALSGIEMASLDILGKSLDTPVWRLLGGSCRDRLRVYGAAGGNTPGEYAASARRVVDEGFSALKLTPFPEPVRYVDSPAVVDRVVERIGAVRQEVGAQVDIAIDFHRAVSPAMARVLLAELEPLKPMFVEEPTHPENVDALLEIARSTTIPIATGERNTTRWGFREIIEKKAAAILQPDIRHCGGILEMRKIAAHAEVHYLALAPHSAADPVGVAASLQVMAATPNFLIQEFGGGSGEGLFRQPLRFSDGYVELPQGPGLGFEIDPEGLEDWRLVEWRLRAMRRDPGDNSVSDI